MPWSSTTSTRSQVPTASRSSLTSHGWAHLRARPTPWWSSAPVPTGWKATPGSALQALLLARGELDGLPPGVAVLVIHAVNPYGMAWERRVDHANVDVKSTSTAAMFIPDY